MKIKDSFSEQAILIELGNRIKQRRIALNITQTELSENSGVSTSTAVRIERGEDTLFSNYLKILAALNLLENVDMLVPEPQPDFKAIYEQRPQRQRASTAKKSRTTTWVWEEDK